MADFEHFWNELQIEDKIDSLYSRVADKYSEMETLIKSYQKYTNMQRDIIVEERIQFIQKCEEQNAATVERNSVESNEIDTIVRQLMETDDVIEANELFSTLKTKVFTHEEEDQEDVDLKQLVERLQLRLDREQRQRAKHLIECTCRMQNFRDQKAVALAEYEPSLNEVLGSAETQFKALLKQSYDSVRLTAAKELQQFIRSKQTAAQQYKEEMLRNKAKFVNEQHELHYRLTEALDEAKKAELMRPDQMRVEIMEMDKLLEDATLESDELRDELLKSKEMLQHQTEVAKRNQVRGLRTDADIAIQITKLTAQREKLQRKYDELLEQITFRRNHYRR